MNQIINLSFLFHAITPHNTLSPLNLKVLRLALLQYVSYDF